ncbi:MAG: hypothetical protein ACO3E1_09900 [Flavobacteriales bacterium]
MQTKKKWQNPQWISLEINNTQSGSGSGAASEAIHSPSSLAVLGS